MHFKVFSGFAKEITPCSRTKTAIPKDLLCSSLPRLSFWETHDKPSLFSNRHLGLFVAGNNIALVHFVHEEWQQRRNCLFGCKIKWFDCKTNGCLYAPTQMKILTNENCWQRQAKLIKKQHWSECGISFTHKLPKLFIMQYFLELFYSAVGLYMDSIYKKNRQIF